VDLICQLAAILWHCRNVHGIEARTAPVRHSEWVVGNKIVVVDDPFRVRQQAMINLRPLCVAKSRLPKCIHQRLLLCLRKRIRRHEVRRHEGSDRTPQAVPSDDGLIAWPLLVSALQCSENSLAMQLSPRL
jgi:hypothetical protein